MNGPFNHAAPEELTALRLQLQTTVTILCRWSERT
jgi:hypothetical protein